MASHHAEWLSLMEVSGPFLSVPVLKDALPTASMLTIRTSLQRSALRA